MLEDLFEYFYPSPSNITQICSHIKGTGCSLFKGLARQQHANGAP